MALPINIRHKIAESFHIPKKGSTHVVDNKIQSDGYLIQDVEEALTMEALQTRFNTTETDIVKLWNELVWRVENPGEERVEVPEFKVNIINIPAKKITKPRKKK